MAKKVQYKFYSFNLKPVISPFNKTAMHKMNVNSELWKDFSLLYFKRTCSKNNIISSRGFSQAKQFKESKLHISMEINIFTQTISQRKRLTHLYSLSAQLVCVAAKAAVWQIARASSCFYSTFFGEGLKEYENLQIGSIKSMALGAPRRIRVN